jgi:putative peptidoglycan lipid II flippase
MAAPGFLASARLIGACTFLSRILGMARDVLTSHVFGATMLMDAFGIAYMVPNLFRRLFGEGALTAAFVPAFVSRVETGKRDEAFGLLNRVLTRLVLGLLAIVAVGIGITFLLPRDPKGLAVAELTRIMLPYVVFICGAAILGGALNGLKHFFAPAFAPVLLNVVWIGAIVWAHATHASKGIVWVAWAILAGGALQFALQLVPLWARGARPRPDLSGHEGLREVGTHFFPVVFGLALVQVNELVDRIIAELCVPGDGAVAALYYGNQLTQLPLTLIGASIATAVFPTLAGAAALGTKADFATIFQKALRATIYIAIPATAGTILFARPIVELVYEHGSFAAGDTTRATGVLTFYIASLWCYCANQVLVRAFYALRDTRTPMRVSAGMVALNLALNLTLVWPMQERGIALATSISGLGSFLALGALLRRRVPELDLRPVWRTVALAALGSVVMGMCAWAVWLLMKAEFGATSLGHELARTLVPIATGAVVYFVVTRLFGMGEAKSLMKFW